MNTQRSSDPLVGQVLDDRYEIVRRVARGGMATVYVATDIRLSRTVALKVMHEGLGADAEFVRRFDAEARAAARLSHPNIVAVFDQGNDRGRPYIVMEYVEGCTLRQLITREAPMDPLRVLDLADPVVSALAAAHRAGFIHRDVKPENVLISDRGQIKVADFGLARAVTAQTHGATAGQVIGTVSYIAPEVVTQSHVDERADVYAMGILLYEMLTGHKPHTGESPIQVAYAHVHHQIPAPSLAGSTSWRDSRAGIPPYLDALVTTAANRDRAHRPADAGVLLAHLRDARTALARGVRDDPALTAAMRRTTLPEASQLTDVVPTLAPREVRFTPSTPLSPGFDVHTDGVPYYADGAGPAASPLSPHTRTLPTVPAAPRASAPAPRRRAGRLITLLVALLAVAGVGYGGWYWLEGRWTAAPVLTRLNQNDAQAAALSQGLSITFDKEYSEDVPPGLVTRTDPVAGARILRDGAVVAFLSRGPERYPVPNLVGQPGDKAPAALTAGFLTPGTVTQAHHDTVATGLVISQSLAPGTQVKKATPIDLVVSLGPAPVELTDFTGKPVAEAKAWLEGQGLKVTASEANSDTAPKGSIISQTPPSGTVHRGDTVTLSVSKGPVMVAVPDVRGKGANEATEMLRAAGFEVTTKRLVSGGFGLAYGTEPKAGTLAPKGSTVVLQLV